MNTNIANKNELQDFKINVRIKLSGLWTAVMFCYIYGDYFSFFAPGHIQNLMDGKMGLGTTTPMKLVIVSVVMVIPSLMVFLSLALHPALSRWLNIIVGILYSVIMVLTILSALDAWWRFYTFLGIVEIIITLLIVWHAVRWPRKFSGIQQ